MNNAQLVKPALVIAIDELSQEQSLVKLQLLTKDEFCSACARGEGCGAIFLNDLNLVAKKNKNQLSLNMSKQVISKDKLAVGDVVEVAISKHNLFTTIVAFYAFPALAVVVLLGLCLKVLLVSELVALLFVVILLALYYLTVSYLIRLFNLEINYIGVVESNKAKHAELSTDSAQQEYTAKIKEL